jgi:hypothetical protein
VRPTNTILSALFVLVVAVLATPTSRAQSVIENGNFANPGDPLKGWIVDYAWAGNSNYMGNKDHVSVAAEGGKNVVKFGDAGGAGVKMESRAFPLEPGFKYSCNLTIKGGGYRVYFAGYQWAPGVHPHDKPELGELRMIYQSKALTGTSPDWKPEKLEIPGIALSEQAIEHLKKVRFLTVYIWMAKPGEVANVNVTKANDPTMNLQ